MELLSHSSTPIQLTLPLPNLVPPLPDPAPEDLILPRHLWTTLTLLQREQLRQRLTALLQEVFHAPDRC
jgi:ParB-like chromosome segregation protein Spo0J